MTASGAILLILALSRVSSYEPEGNVIPGLVIAGLGLLTNGWFWLRYRASNRVLTDTVIAAQEVLYRAKTSVDLCVFLALLAVAFAPTHPATPYIDAIGSVIVALYLFVNGVKMLRKSW